MSTLTIASGKGSSLGCAFLLFCVAALLMAATIGTSISHAIARHGMDAAAVHQCLDKNGHSSLWMNPYNDHYIRVCNMQDGRAGIQVVKKVGGKWEEITAYIPKKAGDLVKFLTDSGAELVWPK